MIKKIAIAIILLFIIPVGALQVGEQFQAQIASSDNSALSWRHSKLAYRIAMFSPFFWSTAEEQALQSDLLLSENFFQEVLRGERDAIVPKDHLDFLENRPETQRWREIRLHTLMTYGQFSGVLKLAKTMQATQTTTRLATHAAFYLGDVEEFSSWCDKWEECPLGWKNPSYFASEMEDWETDFSSIEETLQPVFIEHVLTQEIASSEQVKEILTKHEQDVKWLCAELAYLDKAEDKSRFEEVIQDAWNQANFLSIGNLPNRTLCHPDRFMALEDDLAEESPSKARLRILSAHADITQFNISAAQKKLKEISDPSLLPATEQIMFWHLRILAREAAGDASGMEKYALKGMPLDKALFSIALAKSKFYQQSKTSALQTLSALNGYPINPALEQEYKDMFSFAKRLNGSSSKTQIGTQELDYNFMDNDGNFREWLVHYIAETIDGANNDDLGVILLRFWRGEDKHGDQLLSTHLENNTTFNSVLQTNHQRLLHASLRNDSSLSSSTWKTFSQSRSILYNVAYPQLLHLKPEHFSAPFPRD